MQCWDLLKVEGFVLEEGEGAREREREGGREGGRERGRREREGGERERERREYTRAPESTE